MENIDPSIKPPFPNHVKSEDVGNDGQSNDISAVSNENVLLKDIEIMEFENDDGVNISTKSSPSDSSNRAPVDIGVNNKIQLVEYNYDEKTKRLGRPRNHSLSHIKTTSEDSSKNEIESKYMMYRLNNTPVEGPGSRGGKNTKLQKGEVTGESLRKKKQAQLVFENGKLGNSKPSPESNSSELDRSPNKSAAEDQKSQLPVVDLVEPLSTNIDKTDRKTSELHSFNKLSRTTIVNGKNKITRQFPGPLIPLVYDLYDENLMMSDQHQTIINEPLAFGFKAKKVDYAHDILFLVSYLCKFSHIINLGPIGPQDIEEGLGLDQPQVLHQVSKLMNKLFARMTTLVLNRKAEVNVQFQGKPVAELKAICFNLGLPPEWRDPNEVYEKFQLDVATLTPLSETNDEILISEWYSYKPPLIIDNPFTDKQGFEKQGFPGISNPRDRLIMLRTLAQWSLTASNDIKNAVSESLQKQDVPGDKETFYGPRAVLKGFEHAQDLTNETNDKIQKRKYKEDNEMVAKYVEPCSNPLDHCLRLRFDELVIGDLGFDIGRFYMVRMADEKAGGLSSVKQMQKTWNNYVTNPSYVSRFKLYVEDVHQMLVDQLQQEGVEFDDTGNEVNVETTAKSHIYEIASNVQELQLFINHLRQKLNQLSSSSIIYKPCTSLFEYLSNSLNMLKAQEQQRIDEPPTKKRRTEYKSRYPGDDDDDDYEEFDANLIIDDDRADVDYEE